MAMRGKNRGKNGSQRLRVNGSTTFWDLQAEWMIIEKNLLWPEIFADFLPEGGSNKNF